MFVPRCLVGLPRRQYFRVALLSMYLFAGFATQNYGLLITTASKSAFITGMMVVVVPILQIALEHRAPKIGNILGVLIVVVGLWLLTSPDGSTLNAGDGLTVACAVVFGIYIVYLDILSREMTASQILLLQTSLHRSVRLDCHPVLRDSRVGLHRAVGAGDALPDAAGNPGNHRRADEIPEGHYADTCSVDLFRRTCHRSRNCLRRLGRTPGHHRYRGGSLIIIGVVLSEIADQIPWLKRSVRVPGT